jgi:hypothetical protein
MPYVWKYNSSYAQPTLHIEHSFIHLLVCLTTVPKPLPNRALHIVRSKASSFKWEYPLPSLRSSSSSYIFLIFLSLLSPPSIFPSTACCRRQFLLKMWPIQLAFHFLISCGIFLCSLTLKVIILHFSHDRSNWSSPSFSSTTFQNLPGEHTYKNTNHTRYSKSSVERNTHK